MFQPITETLEKRGSKVEEEPKKQETQQEQGKEETEEENKEETEWEYIHFCFFFDLF